MHTHTHTHHTHTHTHTHITHPYIRGTAFGIHSGVGRIGAILGNVTFGNLIDADIALPILLVASVLAVGATASIFLPSIYRPENRPPLYRAVTYMYSRCCKRKERDFNPRVREKTQTYGTFSTTSFIDSKSQLFHHSPEVSVYSVAI